MARCLDALLALDYPHYEIIVVDNVSTDDTRTIARGYRTTTPQGGCQRVACLDETRRGWPAARNRAWHYSRAPLLANIDADCFAEPTWLTHLTQALQADDTAGCAVGRTRVEPGQTLAQRFYAAGDPFNIERHFDGKGVRTPPWGGGNNLLRRQVVEAIGGYDALTYTSGADREFHRRMGQQTPYRTAYAPQALIWHEARGSMREFFQQAARFAADGVLHSQFDPGVAERMRGWKRRHALAIVRHAAAVVYRGIKLVVGRGTALDVARPFYWSVQASGSIWGCLKGQWRLRRLLRQGRVLDASKAPSPADGQPGEEGKGAE